MTPARSLMILLGWLALVVLTALSGIATPPGDWYAGLAKPPLTPPDLVFPIAWSTLYLLMSLAAWRATLAAPPAARWSTLWPFVAQLAANALWSILFFGLHWMGLALLDLLLLWGLILLTIRRFAAVSRLAAWLLVPYLAWVSFAAYLNAATWWLNGGG
ncbi:TspO/MBR family protein [Halomonas rhizosphaerae]|uniref:Tryptophan-rich sensory protein n=1 Tax=Halomonas rhizosphaerae TaxID=3043296 RepID=A0ABT6UZM4_9GAMM|nr:TspO/MBR family protein [Halomonas rhizosphaerae]MDI5891131.1 tryptophan-rich sensory protein [Halomonas rhizosphaerae]MDI5919488.1 tryptophan-rich sensory protein [Halomonas rhizosphaerae]